MSSGSNCLHLNRPETDDARNIGAAYQTTPAKLQHCPRFRLIMTTADFAKLYNVTERTIRNWQRKQAPFDNPLAMNQWIAGQRSRSGVGKRFRQTPATAQPSVELASQARLPDTVTKLVNDIDRVHFMIVDARESLRDREPKVYARFQEVLAITAKWLE